MNDDELRMAIAKAKRFDQRKHLPLTYFEHFFMTDDGLDESDGWECPRCHSTTFNGPCCPNWPTDIAAAWELVEEMPYNWTMFRDVGHCGDEYETSGDRLYHFVLSAPGLLMAGVEADTAPRAICMAWLKWQEER